MSSIMEAFGASRVDAANRSVAGDVQDDDMTLDRQVPVT
jgi:hypothetical protein